MGSPEEVLAGGNVADQVVKIGATVRKPSTPATESVTSFLEYLNRAGFQSAPRPLGRDEKGRQILEYIPGTLCSTAPPMTRAELIRLGSLIRELHDLSSAFTPSPNARWDVVLTPDSEDLVCHNDLAPWNLIRDKDRWVFIDWDGAGPGSRLWDLSYAAVGFVPFTPAGDIHREKLRLSALVAGYDLDRLARRQLPQTMARRARAMYQLLVDGAQTGRQPWARLHAEGHADYWGNTAGYIERHEDALAAVLMP